MNTAILPPPSKEAVKAFAIEVFDFCPLERAVMRSLADAFAMANCEERETVRPPAEAA